MSAQTGEIPQVDPRYWFVPQKRNRVRNPARRLATPSA